ncbi:MAG: tryptophan synthase subunit alpha, partial [Planctomycetes bacterium]|nr:tryptophan synthase subunit alpha [Planctomycetota bacterium]
PVIQGSYTRALAKKLKLKQIFEAVGKVSGDVNTPLMAMVSYAIIFRAGPKSFIEQAQKAGFAGLIVPDLPGDEATEFASMVASAGMALIQLVAPTTTSDRVTRILKNATGFVYCIAVAGTTGAREGLAPQLAEMLGNLRKQTSLPLAVGFGISRPEHVNQLRGLAEGVIVGSAIVRHFEKFVTSNGPCSQTETEKVVKDIVDYSTSIANAAHQSNN